MFKKITAFLVGPDASTWEIVLVAAGATVLPFGVLVGWFLSAPLWEWWQILILLLLSADLGGGVVANFLRPCKDFYHEPLTSKASWWEKLLKNHLFFSALHVHPIVIWGIFSDISIIFGVMWYIQILIATLLMNQIPKRLKRPVAGLVVLIVFVLNAFIIAYPAGFGWFIPLLFIKLVLGHQVPPDGETVIGM
jgi:hypothetical protein